MSNKPNNTELEEPILAPTNVEEATEKEQKEDKANAAKSLLRDFDIKAAKQPDLPAIDVPKNETIRREIVLPKKDVESTKEAVTDVQQPRQKAEERREIAKKNQEYYEKDSQEWRTIVEGKMSDIESKISSTPSYGNWVDEVIQEGVKNIENGLKKNLGSAYKSGGPVFLQEGYVDTSLEHIRNLGKQISDVRSMSERTALKDMWEQLVNKYQKAHSMFGESANKEKPSPSEYKGKSYKESLAKASMHEFNQKLAEAGNPRFGTPEYKAIEAKYMPSPFGTQEQVMAYHKAQRYAASQANYVTESDLEYLMRALMSNYNQVPSANDILGQLRKKDEDGFSYYAFGYGRIYDDTTATKLVDAIRTQMGENLRIANNPDVYKKYVQEQLGVTPKEYERAHKALIDRALGKISNAIASYNDKHNNGMKRDIWAKMLAATDNYGTDKNTKVVALEKHFEYLKERFGAIDEDSFWKGLWAGGESLSMTADMVYAMNKYNRGEKLNDYEEVCLEVAKANQMLEEFAAEFRNGAKNANFGAGVTSTVEFIVDTAIGTLVTGGVGSLASVGGGVAKQAAKSAVKQTIKQKVVSGLGKGMASIGRAAKITVASPILLKQYGQDQLAKFHFTADGLVKEESNPLYDWYKALATGTTEVWVERVVGGWLDGGAKWAGRKFAQSKLYGATLGKVKGLKPIANMMDMPAVQAVSGLVQNSGINGIAVEGLEEYVSAALVPITSGGIFIDWKKYGLPASLEMNYGDVMSSELAINTLILAGTIGGIGYTIKGYTGARAGYKAASLRREGLELINGIKNVELRDKVLEAINLPDAPNKYNGVAEIFRKSKENGIGIDEADNITQAIFKLAASDAMKGELEETERLNVFAPHLARMIAYSYRGVDMANPNPAMKEVIAYTKDELGRDVPIGYVIFGDFKNPDAMVEIVDGNGISHSVSTEGYTFVEKSLEDSIAETYALMFNSYIEKERIETIMANVRNANGMSESAKNKVLAENGFSIFKKGDIVTLADGRQAVVQGNAKDGKYIVMAPDANGQAQALYVGFESILSENEDTAEAQVELQTEGKAAPIVGLPMKNGHISIDDISDADILSHILPSQFGSDEKAVEALDTEINRLMEDQAKTHSRASKKEGLNEVLEAKTKAEARSARINILRETRKKIAGETAKTTEEVEAKRAEREAEMDAMSTFDFSRDYRSRHVNNRISRNVLHNFLANINKALGVTTKAQEDVDAQISEVEAKLDEAYSKATSETDMERIAEQTKDLQGELNALKEKKNTIEANRKIQEHRKAQYEQTLKDMGDTNYESDFQEGELGYDKTVQEFVDKASKALGMKVEVNADAFVGTAHNAKHVAGKKGEKGKVLINPHATATEQGVGIIAHELSHEFKQFLSPEEWAAFENLVNTARFGEDWSNSEAYKKEIQDIHDAQNRVGEAIDDEKAKEEVVAYALQTFIFNGKSGARAFEAIVNKNPSFKDKIMAIWQRVVDTLKFLFNDIEMEAEQTEEVKAAIAEFENIFKRYAAKMADKPITSANGTESFSNATYHDWVDSNGVKHEGTRNRVLKKLKKNNFTEAATLDMLQRMDDAYAYMEKLRELTDADGRVRFDEFVAWAEKTPRYKQVGEKYIKAITSLVNNGDYPINLEITTDCIKREAFTHLLNEMIKRGADLSNMGAGEIVVIQNMMKQYGIEVACALCFVEGKRLGIVNWASQFVEKWNEALIEAGVETDEYFNFGKDGDAFIPVEDWKTYTDKPAVERVWQTISDVELTLQGRDPKIFKEQMMQNIKAVKAYKEEKAKAWAKRTKKPVEEWVPTEAQEREIKELKNKNLTPKYVGENMQEFRDAYDRMREAWVAKNPKKDPLSFTPTQAQWNALDKIRNRQIENVRAKMVRLIMEHPEMRKKMTLNDLLGSKGLMEIRQQNGEAFAEFYSLILQNFGTATPKPVQDAAAYDGEIMNLSPKAFDKANKIGGARLFSFSDFDITKVFDYMQMFFDLEANKQRLQSYTKEPAAIIALGRSNAKMNISTLAKASVSKEVEKEYESANDNRKAEMRHQYAENAGLLIDAKGNIEGINFSEEHSVDPKFAQEIFHDDTRNKDCGAIMVGCSVNHAIYSAAQDWIRMVIPFHLSGMPIAARNKTDVKWYTDNTPYQNTRKKAGDGWGKLADNEKDFEFYDNMGKKGWNMRDKAREYIAWCEERGYRPKFDWGINSDYYRAYCEENGYTPNQQIIDIMDANTVDGVWNQYYKFLTDFTAYKPVFNEKGEMIDEIPSPQLPVKANFDFSEMEKQVLFEGENSMLTHREGNIKNTKSNLDELATKATAFLNGDVSEADLGIKEDVFYRSEDAKNYLEAKANSLNKLPEGNRNVVDAMDVESYSISRNTEATIDKWFDKRGDFTEETKASFKTYIADFKPATQLATAKWYVNGVIRLPEDMPKVEQAMAIAQKAKVDALQFNSPMEVIDQLGEQYKPKEKLINPDDVPTLTNKVEVPNTDITIYDVEDSEESRVNFRNLMNSHLGKDANPWCLMQANEEGELTSESARYWKHYNKYPKRAAFKDGKVIAFFASDSKPTWWDRKDAPHADIPVVGKIKGDTLGRSATILYSENTGEVVGYDDIHKGNKQNGVYESWYNLEQMHRRGTFVNGKQDGVFESWYENGVKQSEVDYKDGVVAEYRNQWNEDGKISRLERFNNSGHKGLRYYFVRGREDKSTANFWNMSDLEYVNIRWGRSERCSLLEIQNGDNKEWFNFGETGAAKTYSERRGRVEKKYVWLPNVIEAEVDLNMFGVSKYFKGDEQVVRFEDGSSFLQYPQGDIIKHSFKDVVAQGRTYRVEVDNWDGGNNKNVTIYETTKIEDTGRWQNTMLAVSEGAGGWSDLSTKMRASLIKDIKSEIDKRYDAISKADEYIAEDMEKQRVRMERLGEKFDGSNVPVFENVEDGMAFLHSAVSQDMAPISTESFSLNRDNTLAGKVGEILNEYDTEGVQYKTPMDIADAVETLINEYDGNESTTALENIIADYRAAQADSRNWGERMEVGGDEAFEQALRLFAQPTQESYSILRSEDTDTVFATAKEEFASTNDWQKTGWLMPDGTQLDFAEGGDYRGTDHRAIGAAYKGTAEHRWQYLQDFENRGGIRIHMNRDGKYGTLEMAVKPTADQKKRLRSFIGAVGGNVDVDFMDENYNTVHSVSYEGVSPARVLSGITNFYDKGIKPEGNVSYSVNKEGVAPIGRGEFGYIYDQFKGKPHEAVHFLLTEKNGFAKDVFYNEELGNVGLVYGSAKEGLVHLIYRHIIEQNDFDSIEDMVEKISSVVANGKVKRDAKGVTIRNGQYLILIGERKDGDFIVTSYDYITPVNKKRKEVSSSSSLVTQEEIEEKVNYVFLNETSLVGKDTTTNPKNQISEQESFSLSREQMDAERRDIERKAKADGTWLKAPNGKDTNLSPKQWVDVRTKAFKEWFGDWENDPENASKVVDENGEPKVVYHFTKAEFTMFNYDNFGKGNDGGNSGKGFYFTENPNSMFGNSGRRRMDCFLDIRNPHIYNWHDAFESQILPLTFNRTVEKTIEAITSENNDIDNDTRAKVVELLKNLSQTEIDTINQADGVIAWAGDHIFEYVVKDANQIKSATENVGTYNAENPDIRYSLNRDEIDNPINIATERMVAEANEELSREMELIDQLDEAQTALDRLRSKINKRNERKDMTFDEVRKFLLDGDTLQGLQEASKGQYNRIVKNVLNSLEKMPEKRIAVNKLVDKVQEALTSARINVANSNLKAVGKDFVNIIKKKRDGKNTRNETIEKYIADEYNEKFKAFINLIQPLFADKDTMRWSDMLRAGTILSSHVVDGKYIDPIKTKINELYEELVDTYNSDKEVELELLDYFMQVRLKAQEVSETTDRQKDNAYERNEVDVKITALEALITKNESGKKGFDQALPDIKAMGYKSIDEAKTAVDNFKATRKAYSKEMKKLKGEEADALSALVDAVRNLNVALKSFDKEGRVALREKQAKRKEAEIKFRRGIDHSVRNPLYRNALVNEPQKDGRELTWREKRALTRRGTSMWSGLADSFEYQARKLDMLSIPNEWLEDGFYYQFIAHPEQGIIARMDWRYKTEKALRESFNKKVKEIMGVDSIDELNEMLNAKTGIKRTVIHTKLNGEVMKNADPSTIDLTVQQMLYIRAMLKQDNGMAGYLANGLNADDVQQIVKDVEQNYPKLCELADWVMGKDGILEQIYALRNPIYKSINGVSLDHTSEYFPIKRAKGTLHSGGTSVGETIDLSTIAGGIGSNKKRIRNSAPMDINVGFFEVLEQHINESMAWCASAELTHKMNILLGSVRFVGMLKKQGVNISVLKDSFLRAIGEKVGKVDNKTTPSKIITSAARNAVASNVAFNPNAALKQILSGTAVLSQEMSPELWVKALKRVFPAFTVKTAMKIFDNGSITETNFKWWRDNTKWAIENIPTFAERVDKKTMGFDVFEHEGIDSWDELVNWLTARGLAFNAFVDACTCSFVGRAYYDFQYEQNLKRGLTPEQAHKDACVRASILINQTQQSSVDAFLSSRQKDKSGDVTAELFRMGIAAYNNSQMAFDRNTRSAIINIYTMLFDDKYTHAKDMQIRLKAEEYVRRGFTEEEAEKKARKDWNKSLATQFNQLFHNLILNSTLWQVGGTLVGAYASALLVCIIGDDDDYGDEATSIAWDKLHKKAFEALITSAVYLVPFSSNPVLKPWLERGATTVVKKLITDEKQGWLGQSGSSVTMQPLSDLIDYGFNLIESYVDEYKTEEERQEVRTGFMLVLADTSVRYGLGLSPRTLIRIAEGIFGEGNQEDFMNALASPRQLTKIFVDRPRKGETMDEYAERVAGAYKMINGRNKLEDVRKLRKQYTDKMDEILFYNTDFDYEQFKKDKRAAKRLARINPYTARYNPKFGTDPYADEFVVKPKDDRKDEVKGYAPEQKKLLKKAAIANCKINDKSKLLEKKLNWDEDGAKKRRSYYEKENKAVQDLLRAYEQLKNTK